VPFHIYYSAKDALGYLIALILFITVVLFTPNILTDPENFLLANPLVTPIHIKPE
jgi:ubiquinol-cytochrome c reductase cytochrome b subunit